MSNMWLATQRSASALLFAMLVPAVAVVAGPVHASAPVRMTMTGCVTKGEFVNERGYRIKVRARGQRTRLVDLSRWEGMRLRLIGSLSPGDNFFISGAPVVVGRCR
jgi:hypothetical protein